MADEDRGYPTRQDTQRDDVLTTVTAAIMSGFSGLQSDLSAMRKLLEQANKADTKYKFSGGSLDNLYTDIKSATKVLAEFEKRVKSTANSISQERESWNRQSASFSGKSDIERLYAQKRAKAASDAENKLAELYEKSQEDISKIQGNYDAILAKRKELVGDREKTIDDLEKDLISISFKIQETRDANLKATLENEKAIAEQLIEQERQLISNEAKDIDAELSKFTKEKEDAVKESSKAVEQIRSDLREFKENLDEQYSATLRAAEDALSGTASLKGQSAWASKYMQSEEDLETPDDKIAKSIAKQIDTNETAMRNILKLMETATDEDKRVLQKQYDYLSQQTQNLREWTPAREQFSKSVKTLGDAAKNIISSIGKTVLKRFEDYYLNSYKESFQKVYDSVENTRNTVSARLKLDQGGFSDLQSEIQNEIEELGIESSVTQADVNDALVSLQAAGVTDKDMLKTLAVEQAKLIAGGSSLNLGNEEMIQNLRQVYQQQIQAGASQEEALNGISNLLDDVAAYQSLTGQTGWDSSLVNGGIDRIVNNMLKLGITGQKNIDQMSSDIGAYIQASESYYSRGLDADQLYQYINDIANKSIESNTTFEKILQTYGIDRNAVLEKGMGELLREIDNASRDILQQTTHGDNTFISQVSEAYQLGLEGTEAIRQRDSLELPKEFTEEQKEAAKRERDQALQQGTYLSATEKHLNEAQNSMAKVAISAQKLYKGNDYVLEGFNAVETGLNAIEEVAKSILTSMWTNSGTGRAVSSFNLTPEMAKDFALGTKGTTAGAIGKGASIAVGAGMIGYSVIDTIKEHNEGDSALDTAINLTDETTFWSGIGTTVGGAIGGPIAGAVVGGLMGAGSKIGNALAEHIENKLDPFEEAVNDFKESVAKQLSDDESQLNSTLSTLSKYESIMKKNDKNQMKMLLMEEANMSAKELQNITDEKLQGLFMNNLVTQQENLAREKEQQVTLDRILNDNAQVTKELEQDFTGTALTQYGTAFESMSDADKSEYIKSNINQFVGQSKDIIADVGSQISSMSDSDIDAHLSTMGVDADELKKMKPDKKREELHKRFVKEYSEKSNFTEETAALFERAMSDYEERRKTYVSSEKKFQEQWEAAKELTGIANPEVSDIMIAYMDKYHGGGSWGDDVKDIIVNSDGTATLDPGNLYRSAYAFATGLTEVPSDNYPALLHKGERILTREEAKAYNEMSSFAVSNQIGRAHV